MTPAEQPKPSHSSLELRAMEGDRPPSITSSDEGERASLLSSHAAAGYLSDAEAPLIVQPSRRQQVLKWTRVVLRFMLANWYKFAVLGIIITLIVLVSVKGFSIFGVILRWFQARNNWAGWGIFVGMYCAVVALFLPGVVFIMGAGFVFGFWKGLLAVWIGGAVGQALAFLLARYLLRDWVESFVRKKWKKWEYIDKAIELDGWKLVLIMRFSPIIPYNILNIAMGTTSIPFWQFTVVSAFGIIFECAVFCYFGSMAENVTSIASGEGVSGPFEWVMLGLSVVMCIVGAALVSISIKRAVKRAEVHMSTANLESVAAAAMSEEGGGSSAHSSPGAALLRGPGGHQPVALEREGFFSSGTVTARLESPSFELKPVAATVQSALSAAAAAVARVSPSPPARKLKVSGPDPAESPKERGDGITAGNRRGEDGVALKRGDLEMGHGGSGGSGGSGAQPRRRQSGSMGADDF